MKFFYYLFNTFLFTAVVSTPININRIAPSNNGGNQNFEELGEYYEGDMVLNDLQKSVLLGTVRTALIDENTRWPNNQVIYAISDTFSKVQSDYIVLGLQKIEEVSCLRFIPYTGTETAYVEFVGTGSGCSSSVGYLGRRQTINLAPYEPEVGCFRQATIIHEMFHTLGLYHMQSATERDDYVSIIPENVQSGTIYNFNKASEDIISQFGVPYDVGSVMHYGAYAFSSNGYATIVPHDISRINELGQRIGMAASDIQRLNNMYRCNEV